MAILSFSFKKMSIERKKAPRGKMSIKHNARIEEVDAAKFTVGTQTQQAVRVGFTFTADYSPEIANINLQGELLWVDAPEKVKETLELWSKEQKLPKDAMVPIYNTVLQRSLMQSFSLTKELSLPPPVKLPRFTPDRVQ